MVTATRLGIRAARLIIAASTPTKTSAAEFYLPKSSFRLITKQSSADALQEAWRGAGFPRRQGFLLARMQ
jgi:hypothetical protein